MGIGDESCKMRNGDDDKCSEFCLNEICGNGRLDYGEECDDNNTNDGDGCNSICHLEWCPNGIIDTGEECDDDNTIDDDDCNNSCRIQECGDGIKNRAEEECDDGKQCGDDEKTPCNADSDCLGIGDGLCKTRSLDSCDANCKIEFAVCGNNLLEAGEECDDNNLNDGDGCSHTCMNEYIATYDFTAPTQNGINKNKTAWTVSSTTEKPTTWPSFTVANNFNASRPFQVEFNKIAELDWKSENFYYTKIENENNAYFTLDTYQSKYVLHKFEIKIDENEYRLDEVSPKRIESIELQWEGYPTLTGFLWAESRYISLYAWKNDTWTELKVQKWNGWDQADRTLTVEITNDIWSYIDTNRKLNILVGVNKQGANILNTDFFQMQIKAYWYRENYE